MNSCIWLIEGEFGEMTFFSVGDFCLAAAVHAVKSFAAHSITPTAESRTLLRPANAVMQIAESPFTATAILQTLVLKINQLTVN